MGTEKPRDFPRAGYGGQAKSSEGGERGGEISA